VRRYLIDRLEREKLFELAAAFDSVGQALEEAQPQRPAVRSRTT